MVDAIKCVHDKNGMGLDVIHKEGVHSFPDIVLGDKMRNKFGIEVKNSVSLFDG